MSDKSLKEGYYQLQDQKTNTQKYRNNGYQPKKGPIPPPPPKEEVVPSHLKHQKNRILHVIY